MFRLSIFVAVVAVMLSAMLVPAARGEIKVDATADNQVAKCIDGSWELDGELAGELTKEPVGVKEVVFTFTTDPAELKNAEEAKVTKLLDGGRVFSIGRATVTHRSGPVVIQGLFIVGEMKGNTTLVIFGKAKREDGEGKDEVMAVSLARSHDGKGDRLFITDTKKAERGAIPLRRVKEGGAATQPAEDAVAPADLLVEVDQIIKLLEERKFLPLMERYMTPEDKAETIKKEGSLEKLAAEMAEDEKKIDEAVKMLKDARTRKPDKMNKAKTKVYWDAKDGPDIEFEKVDGKWYIAK